MKAFESAPISRRGLLIAGAASVTTAAATTPAQAGAAPARSGGAGAPSAKISIEVNGQEEARRQARLFRQRAERQAESLPPRAGTAAERGQQVAGRHDVCSISLMR